MFVLRGLVAVCADKSRKISVKPRRSCCERRTPVSAAELEQLQKKNVSSCFLGRNIESVTC